MNAPGSIFDIYLESFRIGEGTQRLLNHLVIAMDENAFSRCKTLHPQCFHLTTPGVNFTSEKRFVSPDYLKLMWRRIDFLHSSGIGLQLCIHALQLIEKNVVAIIGPQLPGIAHVISNVVNELHVPLPSFGTTFPSLSALQYSFFLRTVQSDHFR